MSNIDLGRLIVKQTYFVPMKVNKLKNAIFEELDICDQDYLQTKSWEVVEEHGHCFTFRSAREISP